MNRILQAMDVFLFPSLYEGLGIAALEAQAAGLPCIISDSVPSECRVTDLAESLDLNLPIDEWADVVLEKQGTIRKNTYQEIKNAGYDIEQNAKQLENFYIKNMKIWVKGIKYEANIDYFYSDIQSCTYNWSNV